MGSLTKKSGASNLRKPNSTRSSAIPAPSIKKPTSASSGMSNKLNTSEGNIIGSGTRSANRLPSAKGSKVQRALSAKEDASKITRDIHIAPEIVEKSVSCSNTPLLDSSSLRRIPKQLKVDASDGKSAQFNDAKLSSLQPKSSSIKKASKLGVANVRQLTMTSTSKLPKSSNLQPLTESMPLKLKETSKTIDSFSRNDRHGSSEIVEDASSGLEFSTDDDEGWQKNSPGKLSGLNREKSQNSFGSGMEEEESNNSTSESTESVIYQPSSVAGLESTKRSDMKIIGSANSSSTNDVGDEDDYQDDDDDDDHDDEEEVAEVIEVEGDNDETNHISSLRRRNKDEMFKKKSEVV